MDVKFNPSNSAQLVTCGLKHIKFWNLYGNALSSKSGILGKFGPSQSFHSLHFNRSNDVKAGAANGALCRFEKTKASSAQSVPVLNHKVTCKFSSLRQAYHLIEMAATHKKNPSKLISIRICTLLQHL